VVGGGRAASAGEARAHALVGARGVEPIALNLAEELVAQGALAPVKTHRYDRKAWQIVGKTGQNAKLSQ